jgi:hypothetical protein
VLPAPVLLTALGSPARVLAAAGSARWDGPGRRGRPSAADTSDDQASLDRFVERHDGWHRQAWPCGITVDQLVGRFDATPRGDRRYGSSTRSAVRSTSINWGHR